MGSQSSCIELALSLTLWLDCLNVTSSVLFWWLSWATWCFGNLRLANFLFLPILIGTYLAIVWNPECGYQSIYWTTQTQQPSLVAFYLNYWVRDSLCTQSWGFRDLVILPRELLSLPPIPGSEITRRSLVFMWVLRIQTPVVMVD